MEQVKIFSRGDSNPAPLEKDINDWLQSSGNIEITRVLQSSSGPGSPYVFISIFYKKK